MKKTILFLALIGASHVGFGQNKQVKPLPVTIQFNDLVTILNHVKSYDSLITVSKIPFNEGMPVLNKGGQIQQIIGAAYRRAFVADSLSADKKVTGKK